MSRHLMNLLLTWFLIGLWHGAAWNFVVWGLYYGILLILEKYVWGHRLEKLPKVAQHMYSILLVFVGWAFFAGPTLGYAMQYIGMMFGVGVSAVIDGQALYLFFSNWLLLAVCVLASSERGYTGIQRLTLQNHSRKINRIASAIFYIGLFLVSLAFLVTDTVHPFLYFRF